MGDSLASSGTGDQLENADGDPDDPPKEVAKIPLVPKVGQPRSSKWSSLIGVKPLGKSSFSPVKTLPKTKKGSCAIAIPDEIVDHNI